MTRMVVVGYHIVMELYGSMLAHKSAKELEQVLLNCAKDAGLTVVGTTCHQFEPEGATVGILLSESHITAHTWPEYEYISMDIYTCGNSAKDSYKRGRRAFEKILSVFKPQKYRATGFFRGWLHSQVYPTPEKPEILNCYNMEKYPPPEALSKQDPDITDFSPPTHRVISW